MLKERIDNLNQQLMNKEKRFDEQTSLLRQTNKELMEEIKKNGLLAAEIAELKAERAMKLCKVRNCAQREPQSGY